MRGEAAMGRVVGADPSALLCAWGLHALLRSKGPISKADLVEELRSQLQGSEAIAHFKQVWKSLVLDSILTLVIITTSSNIYSSSSILLPDAGLMNAVYGRITLDSTPRCRSWRLPGGLISEGGLSQPRKEKSDGISRPVAALCSTGGAVGNEHALLLRLYYNYVIMRAACLDVGISMILNLAMDHW